MTKQTITVPGLSNPFVQSYTYNELNRISTATETNSSVQTWQQAFIYDRYGNRNFDEANTTTLPKECNGNTEVCAAIRPIVNPSVNTANNRLNGYTFDGSGNTTRDAGSRKFTYDAENKQVKVETVDGSGNPTGTIGEYSYDGDGKRIKKIVPGGETTIFVYDAAGKLIGEYSTVVQTGTNAKTVYTTNDHLGSPRINTDATGNVIAHHDYHPFDDEIATSQRTTGLGYAADTIRKQFTGYERDIETDLDFAQARYFSSTTGRFSSPDDFLNDSELADPRSWNLYSYVRNNPLRFIDPTGERLWIYYRETITRINNNGEEITETVTRRVEYTFDGLRNEDGSAYTGNNSYVLAAANNITFLLQDPVLGRAIRDLVRTRENFNIMRDPNDPNNNGVDNNQRIGKGTNIYWSGEPARYWNNMFEDERSGYTPAFASLAHELIGHAWMRFKGLERMGDTQIFDPRVPNNRGYDYIPNNEIDAVNIENRAIMIEAPGACPPCRTSYAGRDISPYLDFEGFMEPKPQRRKRPTIKLSPNSKPR